MSALDGNAIGGMLYAAFGREMTAAVGTCASCGDATTLAQAELYRGAGTVLRCPHCREILMVVIENAGTMGIDVQGLAQLQPGGFLVVDG